MNEAGRATGGGCVRPERPRRYATTIHHILCNFCNTHTCKLKLAANKESQIVIKKREREYNAYSRTNDFIKHPRALFDVVRFVSTHVCYGGLE